MNNLYDQAGCHTAALVDNNQSSLKSVQGVQAYTQPLPAKLNQLLGYIAMDFCIGQSGLQFCKKKTIHWMNVGEAAVPGTATMVAFNGLTCLEDMDYCLDGEPP